MFCSTTDSTDQCYAVRHGALDMPTAYWLEPAPNMHTATAAPNKPAACTCAGIEHETDATAYNAKHDNRQTAARRQTDSESQNRSSSEKPETQPQ